MFVRCKRRFKDGKEHRYWKYARVAGLGALEPEALPLAIRDYR